MATGKSQTASRAVSELKGGIIHKKKGTCSRFQTHVPWKKFYFTGMEKLASPSKTCAQAQ